MKSHKMEREQIKNRYCCSEAFTKRIFVVASALMAGYTVDHLYQLTKVKGGTLLVSVLGIRNDLLRIRLRLRVPDSNRILNRPHLF